MPSARRPRGGSGKRGAAGIMHCAAERCVGNAGLHLRAHDRHTAAANPAAEQSGNQAWMLGGADRATATDRVRAAKAGLRLVPQFRRNDGELRILVSDPLGFRSHDAPSAFSPRYSDPLRLIPGPASVVALVADHRANRRVAPPPTHLVTSAAVVRRGGSLFIEQGAVLLERTATGEQAKHPDHHGGLGLVGHAAIARVLGVRRVLLLDGRISVTIVPV